MPALFLILIDCVIYVWRTVLYSFISPPPTKPASRVTELSMGSSEASSETESGEDGVRRTRRGRAVAAEEKKQLGGEE